METYRVANEVDVLHDAAEIPGLGVLPVNAFLLRAAQPLLVDTGMGVAHDEFVKTVESLIDPTDIRWIWLTHPDRDHTGAMLSLLEAAPQAKLVTTFAAVGYLGTDMTIPMDRVFLLNPGQQLDLGDRTVTAFRPPAFDSPMTVGLRDDKSGFMFSSDCFGAPMASREDAAGPDAGRLPADALRDGQLLWASVDSPWLSLVDKGVFAAAVDELKAFAPSAVFSSHLPPAVTDTDRLFANLATAGGLVPFVGPDQAALAAMLAEISGIPEQAPPTGATSPV
jgi:glyoxylase-like metal-dependent hydrolase (beta-lactamase superfamily II)